MESTLVVFLSLGLIMLDDDIDILIPSVSGKLFLNHVMFGTGIPVA